MYPFQNYELFAHARSGGQLRCTTIVGYLYSFHTLFVLYCWSWIIRLNIQISFSHTGMVFLFKSPSDGGLNPFVAFYAKSIFYNRHLEAGTLLHEILATR